MPRLTDEQLDARRHGIGSSDIAKIAGVSRWGTIWDVFNDKLGVPKPPEEPDEAWEIGHELEEWMADWYTRVTGNHLLPGGTIHHPLHPWAYATLDRKVVGVSRVLEIKIVGGRTMFDWKEEDDGVPHEVRCQGAWAMACLGVDGIDVATCLAATRRRIYRFERDRELEERLLTLGKSFWSQVQKQEAPPLDASDACAAWIAAKWPRDDRPLEHAPADVETAAQKRIVEAAAERKHGAAKALLDAQIKEAIGDRAGFIGEGWRASWKVGKGGVRRYRFAVKGDPEDMGS